jgi:hypothetical protein
MVPVTSVAFYFRRSSILFDARVLDTDLQLPMVSIGLMPIEELTPLF